MRFFIVFLPLFLYMHFYAQSGCCSDLDELVSLSVEHGVSYEDACLMCCLSQDAAKDMDFEFESDEAYQKYNEANLHRCKDLKVGNENGFFQNPNPRGIARVGNQHYEDSLFSASEVEYRRSLNLQSSDEVKFNLANSLYNQGRHGEAISYLNQIVNHSKDTMLQSEAYYNIGNNLIKQQNTDAISAAIEAYKNCLKLNPNDEDARYNLAKSISLLDKQNSSDNNNDNQEDESQSQNSGETDSNEENKNQNNNNEKGESPSQNQNNELNQDEKDGDSGNSNNENSSLSKEEIERILQSLERQGKEIEENMKKEEFIIKNSDKDW